MTHGVHLVEARRQRIVVGVARPRVALAADEAQPRRGDRDREGQRVAAVLRADVGARVHEQLVGERRQRGQHARAAHDDAVVGVGDLVQRDLPHGLFGLGLAAVDLRVHERVGGRQVVVAHERLVGDEVGGALLVAAPGPHVGPPGEAGEGDVQVVGRAAHRPARQRGDDLEGAAAALEIGGLAGDDVGDVDLTRRVVGRGDQHLVGVLVLDVEDARHRQRGGAQLGVVERVGDALAAQPDLAPPGAQPVEELLPGAGPGGLVGRDGGHQSSPGGSG